MPRAGDAACEAGFGKDGSVLPPVEDKVGSMLAKRTFQKVHHDEKLAGSSGVRQPLKPATGTSRPQLEIHILNRIHHPMGETSLQVNPNAGRKSQHLDTEGPGMRPIN